ncbi:MAG: tetratricopeptide repeat protein [Candidatus Kapaibacteriota bacterium]|jgi:tetratricopeptide (TPR) repeat protein
MISKRALIGILLSAVILIVTNFIFYFPVLKFDFVWDDKPLYINSNNIPSDKPFEKCGEHFVPKKDKMYIPVTYFFWSVVSFFGGNANGTFYPYPFHLFNLIIHILNSIILLFLLRRFLNSNLGALFGAMIYSLHPIQIEAVAWISEARGLLSAFFGFTALLVYLYFERNVVVKNVAVGFLILLSILSKPSGVVFPFLLLLIDWFIKKDTKIFDVFKRNWFFLVLVVPFIFISIRGETTKVVEIDIPYYFRPLLWLNSIGFYLQKTALPINLSPGYGITFHFLKNNIIYFYPLLVTLISLFLGYFLKFKKQYWFAFLFFIVGYLPLSNLVSYYFQYWSTVADRYIYISLFGFSFFFAFLYEKYITKYQYVIVMVLPLFFFIINRNEIVKWENEYTLWDDCIKKYPERIPHVYLGRGMMFEQRGELYSALEDYTKSIVLDSNYYFGYYNRGNIYYDLKKLDNAIIDFTRAIQTNPQYVNTYVNRGLCYLEKKEYDSAISDFLSALRLDSGQVDVVLYLAESFELKNDVTNALQFYRKAMSMGYNAPDLLQRIQLLEKLNKN